MDDRRGSFRIDDAVRLKVTEIDDAEWQQRVKLGATSSSGIQSIRGEVEDVSYRLQRKMIEVKRVSKTVAEALDLVSRKLDIVVEHLVNLQSDRADLEQQPLRTCELGANGIRYPSRRQFRVGQKLHLRLMLETDGLYMEALGIVTRCDRADDTDEFMVAVEFADVRESDADALIRHLLSRQSETIRARRLEVDGAGVDH